LTAWGVPDRRCGVREKSVAGYATLHFCSVNRALDIEVGSIGKLEIPHPVRIDPHIGGRTPTFCVAHGRAILAHGRERIERVLAWGPMP
jgi:DNA-binding IclR family transcriptional regulator